MVLFSECKIQLFLHYFPPWYVTPLETLQFFRNDHRYYLINFFYWKWLGTFRDFLPSMSQVHDYQLLWCTMRDRLCISPPHDERVLEVPNEMKICRFFLWVQRSVDCKFGTTSKVHVLPCQEFDYSEFDCKSLRAGGKVVEVPHEMIICSKVFFDSIMAEEIQMHGFIDNLAPLLG